MERTGQRLGPGTHTQEISLTCAHTPSHLTDVTLARKAHSLTETFSGYERTISENDEEQLLLAQRFDLAPVLCGINGMGGGLFMWVPGHAPLALCPFISSCVSHQRILHCAVERPVCILYACEGYLCRLIMRSRTCERRLCVSCMRVVLPHQQSLPSPNADTHLHSDNAIRRHHRNLI